LRNENGKEQKGLKGLKGWRTGWPDAECIPQDSPLQVFAIKLIGTEISTRHPHPQPVAVDLAACPSGFSSECPAPRLYSIFPFALRTRILH